MPTPSLVSGLQEAIASAEALLERGQPHEAMTVFERVLHATPDDVAVVCGIATIADRLGFPERAVGYMREAIARDGTIPDYHVTLGRALFKLRRLDEASASLRRALVLAPNAADAFAMLGSTLLLQGRLDAAVTCFQRALAINPNLPEAHHDLGVALKLQGQMSDALVSFQTAITLHPELGGAYQNLVECLAFLPGATAALMTQTLRRWSELQPRPAALRAFANERAPDRVLRIGYVSGNFHAHPVSYFLESILAAHDRGAVEVTCYSNNIGKDEVTDRLVGLVDRWRVIADMSDDDAEALVHNDAIDILVDLAGHTTPPRLALFTRKPAPVQCTWLGYYATTGLPEIDYIIADRVIVPPGEEAFYTEQPWRMPDSYLCFTEPAGSPDVNGLPAAANGVITFGSCNRVTKLNNLVINLWSRILHAVPGSRLVLRDANLSDLRVAEEVVRKFAATGIVADRLTILGLASRTDMLATYHTIDIALDPFPYAGGTTTMEALWMGVPVITKRGERFSGRVSESILTTIGFGDLVAESEAAYLEKAVGLAQDTPRLAELRHRLRPIVVASPICDARRFARNLETAYRAMWREWCMSAALVA